MAARSRCWRRHGRRWRLDCSAGVAQRTLPERVEKSALLAVAVSVVKLESQRNDADSERNQRKQDSHIVLLLRVSKVNFLNFIIKKRHTKTTHST